MRSIFLLLVIVTMYCPAVPLHAQQMNGKTYYANDHHISYMGRVDFTDPKLPRFWQPGVTISIRVEGDQCDLVVQDEELWGSNHNYIEIIADGNAVRLQTKSKRDTINAGKYFSPGKDVHTVELVKNTEANIGYMEFVAVRCEKLLKPGVKPSRKIEFIGNSITCGAGSDMSAVPCGNGKWHDQHNAYLSYASITGRTLNAQYHLSSVSGIGLMHSCCNMNIIMPQVYDKISMRNDTITWNFKKYQAEVVTVCLGQNDGVQDSTAFCNNYISFLKRLRGYYPKATFILLSSPMADEKLKNFMATSLASIQQTMRNDGDKKIYRYIFSKQYIAGCDYHPSVDEHKLIATELTVYIKKIMKW